MQETWVPSRDWEDSPGEGNGNPFQYSCLENPIDRRGWQAQSMASQRVGHNLVTKQQQKVLYIQ